MGILCFRHKSQFNIHLSSVRDGCRTDEKTIRRCRRQRAAETHRLSVVVFFSLSNVHFDKQKIEMIMFDGHISPYVLALALSGEERVRIPPI